MRQDTLRQDNSDAVDEIVAEWRRERPDLDPAAKHLTGRLLRLASLFQAAYAEAFAPLGLNEGDYGVLAALRRAGAPHRLTPSDLARHQMMTSGGMTAAIDRLERRGLVGRRPNPNDRRGTLVELTDEGRTVVDRAMELQAAVEIRLVQGLRASERRTLEQLLRKLLLSVDKG
jgi:DNA-binding MarR family transcriptional regulator